LVSFFRKVLEEVWARVRINVTNMESANIKNRTTAPWPAAVADRHAPGAHEEVLGHREASGPRHRSQPSGGSNQSE